MPEQKYGISFTPKSANGNRRITKDLERQKQLLRTESLADEKSLRLEDPTRTCNKPHELAAMYTNCGGGQSSNYTGWTTKNV